VENDTLVA
jgi:hypothetical protein